MKEQVKITRVITIIWTAVALALLFVLLIAYTLNKTAIRENERSYNQTLTLLAESTTKSLKLYVERVISEIILLTEVDAVREYRPKEVELAFRGIIANRGESISHLILLNGSGEIVIMLTRDPQAKAMAPQIRAFYERAIQGWSAAIAEHLFTTASFRGIAIGMPIFRKLETTPATDDMKPSSIYKAGMVIAVISTEEIRKSLLEPVGAKIGGFAWLVSGKDEVVANKEKINAVAQRIYGAALGSHERFLTDFMESLKGEKPHGWSGSGANFKVDLGADAWLVAVSGMETLKQRYTLAIASPRTAVTAILNKSFLQSIGLFLLVVIILTTGAWLMTRAQRQWARAEERALFADTLEKRNRALRDLNRRIDEFVAVVSHDIRTPLNVIRGMLKMIASDPDGAKFTRETTTMLRSSDRLMQLVNDILDISRLEAGKVELAYDPIIIDDLIRESVMILESVAGQKGETISLELGEVTPMEGDSSKLLQVLNNLMANAIKFTPEGGAVALRKFVSNGEVVIQIADTGPGIPENQQAAVFDKFEQAKMAHQGVEPGSGLGLSICKSLVELHQGKIEVASEPGEGSTFTVTLPLKRGDARGEAPDTVQERGA